MLVSLTNHITWKSAQVITFASRLLLRAKAKDNFHKIYLGADRKRFYSEQKGADAIKNMLGKQNLKKLGLELEDLQNLNGLNLQSKKNVTVSVEGNIGCGKTTLLEFFKKNSPNVESIPEPVEQWTNVRGHNALALLYQDPKRWSFSFNSYAQLSRIEMHKKPQVKPVKMLERSLYSTQYCFVENDYRNGTLNGLEHAILTEWFNWLIETQKVQIDLIVYLQADPEICHQRIKKRSRKEESCVPYKLIEELHNLHEDWLIHQKCYKAPAPVLVVDANNNYDKMINIYEDRKQDILCGYC